MPALNQHGSGPAGRLIEEDHICLDIEKTECNSPVANRFKFKGHFFSSGLFELMLAQWLLTWQTGERFATLFLVQIGSASARVTTTNS